MKITKADHKRYFKEKGDKGFSPDHNRHVIESTIREHDKDVKRNQNDFVDKLMERTDAVAWYLLSRKANSGYGPEKYFSKRELAYLRGQQIVNKLKMMGTTTKERLLQRASFLYAKKEKQRPQSL